jgi:hypothetical protein
MIYSSGSLHHSKNALRGYLFKKANKEKFYSMKNYYKRYFIVTHKQSFIQIQDQPVTKKYK